MGVPLTPPPALADTSASPPSPVLMGRGLFYLKMGKGDERHFLYEGLENTIFVCRVYKRPFFVSGGLENAFFMFGLENAFLLFMWGIENSFFCI